MDPNLSVFDILKYVLFKMVSPLFDSVSCQSRNKEGVKCHKCFIMKYGSNLQPDTLYIVDAFDRKTGKKRIG